MSVAFPSSLLTKIRRSRLDLNENVASFESIVTRKRQLVTLSGGTGDRWEGFIETVPLDGTDLRTMWAHLLKVGLTDTFTIGDPDYTGPISGQSSILVNGASQAGMALICDGATPSVICLREGEYFQVGNGFHAITADATADGSGNVTLNFKPALRVSPANNATVQLATPKMLLRYTLIPSKETDDDKVAVFNLPFVEAV